MIQISDSAQAHFRKLIEREAQPGLGVRLAAVHPGTPKADVRLEFAEPADLHGDEWAIDCEGFTVWLDAPSAPFLDGARMAAALVATSAWMVWSALAAPSTAPENAAAGARPIDAQG